MLFERDYMRNDKGSSAISSFYWIMLLTCGIYAAQVLTGFFFKEDYITSYGALYGSLSKYSIANSLHIWTPLSYGFLHGTVFHILCNMLGYYFLGRAILGILNEGKFLTLYLGGIIAGGVLWLIFNQNGASPLIGASAGVSALLIFFCCVYANRPVAFLFVPIFIPARLIGWGFFFLTLFLFLSNLDSSSLQDQNGTVIAHSAHMGGILWGWFYYKVLYPVRIVWPRIVFGRRNRQAPHSSKATAYHYKVNISSQTDQDALRREVDRILDKINTLGFGALTEQEKQTLDQARNILKR